MMDANFERLLRVRVSIYNGSEDIERDTVLRLPCGKLKEVGKQQGVRTLDGIVDLSLDALQMLPGMEDNEEVMELLEIPEDLQLLQEEVREHRMNCFNFQVVPEWLRVADPRNKSW